MSMLDALMLQLICGKLALQPNRSESGSTIRSKSYKTRADSGQVPVSLLLVPSNTDLYSC
jgi:hypothetical protein